MAKPSQGRHATYGPDRPLTPSERWLAHRRRIFVRDWILALIALGLAIAASAIRPDRAVTTAPHLPAAAARS